MNSCNLYFCFLYIELLVKFTAFYFFLFFPAVLSAQKTETNPGLVIGTILDADNSKAVTGAYITLTLLADSMRSIINEGAGVAAVLDKTVIMGIIGAVTFGLGLKMFKWY